MIFPQYDTTDMFTFICHIVPLVTDTILARAEKL